MSKMQSSCTQFRLILVTFIGVYVTLTSGQINLNCTVQVDIPELGIIQGRQGVTSRDQTPYWTFHGIPYAESASYTGANRFKPPVVQTSRLTDEGEVFNANRILVYCPQEEIFDLDGPGEDLNQKVSLAQDLPGIFRRIHQRKRKQSEIYRSYASDEARHQAFRIKPLEFMGQENCLTINVNTPNIPTNAEIPKPGELLPVVVFYHGGGSDSVWGSAFVGMRMLEDPVVLVTMNYRLGVLGAFNLGTDDAPGNAAMYDAVVALEWVQKYIKYFGGDATRVTISGQSAGSMMVANLVVSPITENRNLFQRVWGFSGSAISVWAVSEHPSLPHHLKIAALAGCHDMTQTPDIAAITSCMQGASLDALVTALGMWKYEEERVGRLGYDARMPSIQAPGLSIPYFMPKHPHEALQNVEVRNVEMVLGATRHDGSYPLDDIYHNFILHNGLENNATFLKNDLLPLLLQSLGIKDDSGELYHAMGKTYLGDSANTGTIDDKLPGLLDMVTVMGFKAGELETLRHQSKVNKNAYFYSLDYFGRWSLYNFLWGDMYIPGGICHTDDLIYFFWLGPLLNEDMKVSRRWMKYFINFAYHGNPNGLEGSPDYKEVWPPYNDMTHPYLSLNRTDRVYNDAEDKWLGVAKELWGNPELKYKRGSEYYKETFQFNSIFEMGSRNAVTDLCSAQPEEPTTEQSSPPEPTTDSNGGPETTTDSNGGPEPTTNPSRESTTQGASSLKTIYEFVLLFSVVVIGLYL